MLTTTHPIPVLVDEFLSERDVSDNSKTQYRKVLTLYFRYMQAQSIDPYCIAARDVVAYKAHLNRINLYTSNGYLSIVKAFYKWIAAKGYGVNVTTSVKKNKGFYGCTKKILNTTQVKDIYTAIPSTTTKGLRDNAIVRLMLSTGIRTIEAVRANIGDIERTSDSYILRVQRKGRLDKSDFVAITNHIYDDIAAYLCTRSSANPDDPLFASVRIGSPEARLSTRCVSGMVKAYMVASGINDRKVSTHSLRHTFACWLVREGVDIYEIMLAMGHSSVKTTEIYTKMMRQELKLSNRTGKAIESILSRNGIT